MPRQAAKALRSRLPLDATVHDGRWTRGRKRSPCVFTHHSAGTSRGSLSQRDELLPQFMNIRSQYSGIFSQVGDFHIRDYETQKRFFLDTQVLVVRILLLLLVFIFPLFFANAEFS